MRESESVGGVRRLLESDRDCGGRGSCEAWKSVKKGGFGVESKSFEVEVEEKRGRLQATIVERKGGISSWIRLGPASLGVFLECLGGAFSDWVLWIWRARDLASSFPKEEEQRVVGPQWWRRYGVWAVQTEE
ncbi:hypothetical protein CK203_115575 [Vitis vinifera]|uniref:Uncharacterized protein n=1 Tax=Vitis vinifera TaxID=29760 RepID=A0A438FHR0_VITVI|nr:hypothetical protein CK203_115575 [Vitis vinifera]